MSTNIVLSTDTIAALATPSGSGGIGVIRISGSKALEIASKILHISPTPRFAHYGSFFDANSEAIDQGIALYFPGPNSFTGENVLELQGHGGSVVMDMLLQRALELGARMAKPGEFSERAYLNDKLDLAQAEAIADLINSNTTHAARCALRSLQGAFSKQITAISDQLLHLRMYVEAAIDFPEEEIDFLADSKLHKDLDQLSEQFCQLIEKTHQGQLIQEGMHVVIAGPPNAGKSSLLNTLAGRDAAIVTSTAGTTRDTIREHISINGMPLHITDTAGLRDTDDEIEKEGIKRAKSAIEQADMVLVVLDANAHPLERDIERILQPIKLVNSNIPTTIIKNKIDLTGDTPSITPGETTVIKLSAQTDCGIHLLKDHLSQFMGRDANSEATFTARRRHVDALNKSYQYLLTGIQQLKTLSAGELLAEDLKLAHRSLGEITGQVSADDMLGAIFSQFCIGK